MQTDIFENLDDLSPESREKLRKQIERVQKEARILKAQALQLRRAQRASFTRRPDVEKMQQGEGPFMKILHWLLHTETVEMPQKESSQGLFGPLTQSSKEWGQNVLKKGSELTSSGMAIAGSQLKSGQQAVFDRGGELVQDWGQRGSDAMQSMSDWRDETLRKQRRNLARNADDLRDEAAYKLRQQGRQVGRNLADRRDDIAYKLHKQKRSLGRDLVDYRDDVTHKLRKQGRHVSRDLADYRDDTADRLRDQSHRLVERGGVYLTPIRETGRQVWPFLGFMSGLLLAAGVTFWLVRRSLRQTIAEYDEQIELPTRGNLDGSRVRPGGEIRYTNQGGTAVATRPSQTSTETATRFVGVVSTKQYYPIEKQPDASDLIFFVNEEAAQAEGFTEAR